MQIIFYLFIKYSLICKHINTWYIYTVAIYAYVYIDIYIYKELF